MRKIWDIHGGVHPPENKAQSNSSPIANIVLPKEIILPLNQHIGAPAIPKVAVGDKVLKGQIIADAQGLVSAPVHASTSGTISAIEDRAIPHASGLSAPCIVIECDGQDTWTQLEPNEDYLSLDKTSLVEKIRNAGIAGMGGAGFPTAVKLSPRADQKIETLILNGTECEPYITADDMLMRERADDIVAGAQLLAHLLGSPKEIIIGIEDNKPEAVASMQKAAEGSAVEIAVFPTKYPSGGEKQLIQILTGKEVPSGGIPAQLGIVVQNVGTALAAYRAARFGEPLISRVTTVVGEALNTQQNIEVLIGTPIEHILDAHGFDANQCARLIIGGPMMGYAMQRTDIPLIKTTNCVLVPSHTEMPEQTHAQPCIRCGMCAEACPASLLPQQLYWYAQTEEVDKLKSHNLFDCIECGACSYVCPSNIPLVQYYRASKGVIRKLESDKHKSDRSRQRFEFRQERIQKAEAEKEAKRLARKKAAEEAKKKLAEKGNDDTNKDVSPVSTAATSKAAKAVDPATQKAKLERALTSAKGRMERAQTQLEEGKQEGDSARIESLEARLKQAEQKLSDAQAKLDNFESSTSVEAQPSNASEALTTDSGNADSNQAAIKEKLALSPVAKQEKTITTLKKRLATAEEKYAEAQQSNAATADALGQGVEKLRAKLQTAETELTELQNQQDASGSAESPKSETSASTENTALSAADAAIEKAKAKAEAMANMSPQEKAQANIESLKTRLEKAKQRLAKAEAENSEHVAAFKAGAEKLEKKLQEAEQQLAEETQ